MLSDNTKERYKQQILLQNIGESGQAKLLNSKVLIIGLGGLGSPSAMYLAAAGIGTIGLADGDNVSLSNLQRQILHTTQYIDKPKTMSAKERLASLNPSVDILTYPYYFDKDALVNILHEEQYDFVIEATDSFDAKYLINDACVDAKIPYSHGGVAQYQGETMTYVPNHACYRCFVPSAPYHYNQDVTVFGPLAGIIGTIQATEALKYLLGIGSLLIDSMLIYDSLYLDCRRLAVHPNPRCICHAK